MNLDPLDVRATPARLRQLAANGKLDSRGLERALLYAGHVPDRAAWARFLDGTVLLLAVALTLSGIIFFFAYNWADMHRFVKFGLIEAALLIAVGVVARWGRHSTLGKGALLAAAILVGALLAVFGQAYQTGADSFQLFLGWAVLIGGWVLISNFTPLWLILLVLLNTSLVLYWEQRLDWDVMLFFGVLTIGNALWLLAWEYAQRHGPAWLQGRWFPQLVALWTLSLLTLPMVQFFWEEVHTDTSWLAPVLYLILGGAILFSYRIRRDLFILTMVALSLIVVLTAGAARLLGDDFGGYIVLSILVVAQAALAVQLLRRVQRSWEGAV